MNKILTGLTACTLTIAGALFADAQLTRSEGDLSLRSSERRSVAMPRGLEKRVHPASVTSDGLKLAPANKTATPRRRTAKGNVPKSVLKAQSRASNIEGNCIYREGAADLGWYSVTWPKDAIKWVRPAQYSPTCGFVRGTQLYAFYSLTETGNGIVDAGMAIHDVTTGQVLQYFQIDFLDSYEQIALCAAYDAESDEAYLVTYNKAGKGYLLQKFNPETGAYTNLGVTVPSNFLDFAWNPEEGTLFLLDEDGKMFRYDSRSKKFTNVCQYNYDMTDYPNDMVYSPKDNAFFALLDSYDDSDYPCTDAVLLSLDGKVSYLGTITGNPQYSILHIADRYVNANGTKAPVVKKWDVSGAATSGNLVLTLPSTYENGSAISGTIYLNVEIDGENLSGTFRGTPGTEVSIPFSTTEGLHRFKVTPYTLSDDGRLYGTALVETHFFGIDTPAKPKNVTLSADKVTWDPVNEGANGGYIEVEKIRYNVYVDGIKMNSEPVSGTSLNIEMPASGVVAHRASVTAIAADKESDPGMSGKFYTEGPLPLPVRIAVEEGESELDPELINMFTIVKDPLNTEDLRGWRYDDQSEKTGGFYCLTPLVSSAGDNADEWLFLPPITFPDKDAHYRFTVDLWSGNHYFTSNEYYEIAIAKRPSGKNATVIHEKDIVYKGKYFELSESLFQVPDAGDYYIGIHYVSPIGSYRLYARNFCVEQVGASSDSPAAVTDINAVACANGELAADITFKMPLKTISGTDLPASSVITATAESDKGSASVTGKPGAEVSLKVPTHQGDNIIRIVTSSDAGKGLTAETLVYTGVYRPGTVIVESKVADDNQSMTLNVEVDDFNENDQYVGPDQCEYTVYRKVGSTWVVAAELGKNRTWTFECPEPTKQELYAFGVAAKNAAGSSEEMATFGVHLGKLFTLPMEETFPTEGDDVTITYEPISLDHISYLPAEWGFCDPADADEDAANGQSTALYATWEAISQALLPRFSTKGLNNVKLELNLFFGNKSPELITVYASSPAIEMEPIATFTREDGKGWENKLISLPASCQNKGWVQIIIRVEMKGYSQFFLLDSYSIANYPENMSTIASFKGNARAAVGDKLTYTAEIENAGTADIQLPDYTCMVLTDNGVTELRAIDAPAVIEPRKKAVLNFEYTAKSDDKGEMLVRLNIAGQPEQSVAEAEVNTTIINAPVPVVKDLKADVLDNDKVALSWSVPQYTESFEAFEPWDYSEEMRGFRNLDLDGKNVWMIKELQYPGKGFAKAFQIFTGKSVDNPMLQANSGEYYLACLSATKGESDDWFISPEIKGGTELSFYMNICDGQYPETIIVEYSSTGNEPSDFTGLKGGYICPDQHGWLKYTFTLPEDARYFALHHVGDDGDSQFGLMIDDLSFTPLEGAPVVEGYNLYRDGELLIGGLTTPGYVDNTVDLSAPVMYTVKTLSTVNGEKIESDRSNVIWAGEGSAVENILSYAAAVRGGKNYISIAGLQQGAEYFVADTNGRIITSGESSGKLIVINATPGVYVVTAGNEKAKVIVR